LLLVDAFQGVQAQTVANAYAAINANLEVIPVVNKVDLPVTRVDEVLEEIETVVGLDTTDVLKTSGKCGIGMKECIKSIIERIPPPKGNVDSALTALIFDSKYDVYRGVVTYIRVMDGSIRKGQKVYFMKSGSAHEVLEIGQFRPDMV